MKQKPCILKTRVVTEDGRIGEVCSIFIREYLTIRGEVKSSNSVKARFLDNIDSTGEEITEVIRTEFAGSVPTWVVKVQPLG